MKELRAILVKEKETDNTIRFEEVEQPGAILVTGRQYVRKAALALIGNPEMVEIIIRPMKAGA